MASATATTAHPQAANALRALLVTARWSCMSSCAALTPSKLAATAARRAQGDRAADRGDQPALGTVAERQLALTAELTTWTPNWTGLPPGRPRRCGSCAGSALRSLERCW